MVSSFLILDHTQRHTTVGRTPQDEGSARLRDLYLTIRNTSKREITMPQAGFEPAIPDSERRQTLALDRAIKIHTKIIFVFIYGLCDNVIRSSD